MDWEKEELNLAERLDLEIRLCSLVEGYVKTRREILNGARLKLRVGYPELTVYAELAEKYPDLLEISRGALA